MTKKMIVSAFVCGILMATNVAFGQTKPVNAYYTFNWNISVPIGDFNKWIAPASFLGFSANGRYFLADGFGLGWHLGYSNYYEKDGYKTYYFDGGAISASHYNYTFSVPFKMDIFYHYKPQALISPYIGIGLGGNYQENHLLIQEMDLYENTWNFLFTGEAGAMIRFDQGSSWGVLLGAEYMFTTAKTDWFDLKNFQMVNFTIGVAYTVF